MAKAALKLVPAAPETLDTLIDRMEDIRNLKRPLEAQIKPLEEEYKAIKAKVIALLDEQKNLKGGTARASVSISSTDVPITNDIETLAKYLIKTKNTHLFLAQPLTTPSWQELYERSGKDLPGMSHFTKRNLTHSSITK